MSALPEIPGVESDLIADFYTRHPYPPPVENLDRALDEWSASGRERAEFHLYWPRRSFRRELDILIAGCGTWQAAKFALCRREARVAGVDVSATSIEHSTRLKQKYGLANLELRHLPIEELGAFGRRFDLVVCTGVLHHLADPAAGLRALRNVLKPDGALYLMVYAPYGRAGIYLLQDYCRRLGIGASQPEIGELIETLRKLPAAHPLAAVLRNSRDASDADALADALLNPRDRAYSVPQLLALLESNGLEFGRWYWQAPYLPDCGAIAATAHAARLLALSAAEQYAALELWRGSMTAHSLIAYRGGNGKRGAAARGIGTDDAGWRQHVPLRLPWTRLVQERLPAGAAGMLVNRGHAWDDLPVVLRSTDRKMFESIDGSRSIERIAADSGAGDLVRVRAFFETLWRHDHVTFDASAG